MTQPLQLKMPAAIAHARLCEHVAECQGLAKVAEPGIFDDLSDAIRIANEWHARLTADLTDIFVTLPVNRDRLTRLSQIGVFSSKEEDLQTYRKEMASNLGALRLLASLLEHEADQPRDDRWVRKGAKGNKRVFVVHGHDPHMKEATARLIESWKLKSVVLHEHPSRGSTIVEKLEEHADVGFAVVLFSPDDEAIVDGKSVKRARQNVVFEMGFFHALLGRNRVAVLHRGGVEILSDYSGVIWIPFDQAGGWQAKLKQELRAAGMPIAEV